MYNILLGGAAGDGIETMSTLLEKLLKQAGFHVFTTRDFMSRVRGGHNFVQIRFGETPIESHCQQLDGIFAMNGETFTLHHNELTVDGFVICDTGLGVADKRMLALPLGEIAKELGNGKVSTSVAIGAILSLFKIDLSGSEQVLARIFKAPLVKVNLAAIQKGYVLTTPRYNSIPQNLGEHMLISGTNASTLGAVAAGLKFYSAYPMSPSTGILDYLSEHGEKLGIVVEQAEDEIAAVNMAIGAAYAGAPAMTGTSGGGFSLMVEALGFAGIAEIPLVIADVQRPGPATGLPTRTEQSDLKFVINASQGEFPRMVIALRHHQDAFYQTARAFALAKKYQIPVILLSDQHLGDSTATVPAFAVEEIYKSSGEPQATTPYKSYALGQNSVSPGQNSVSPGQNSVSPGQNSVSPGQNSVSPGQNFVSPGQNFVSPGQNCISPGQDCVSPRLFPGKSDALVHADSDEHDEYGFITESAQVRRQMVDKRMGKLEWLKAELLEPDFIGDQQCETLLLGFGSTYGAIKEAVSLLGAGYAALVFGDVYPLPTQLLTHWAAKAHKIICVEQNATGQLAALIRETTGITCTDSILKYDGRQLTAKYILDRITVEKGGQK